MRRLVAAIVAVGLLSTACGDDASSEGTAPTDTSLPSNRPPLDSPPDPGPVPVDDGLDDETRARVVASTARVSGTACGRLSEGSAFAVADDVLVTNAHVIVGVDVIEVDLVDGRRLEARAAAFDPGADLALLRVPGADLVPLPLGGADDGTIGALIGWEREPAPDPTPFRIDRPVTVRVDEVASEQRVERPSWLLAARVEAGDSGAALVDPTGTVVGIAYATTTRNAEVGYAVRASELEALIAEGLSDEAFVPEC